MKMLRKKRSNGKPKRCYVQRYAMSQYLPRFATISCAFRHRFTAEVIEGVLRWMLKEVARTGYLSPEVVFVDGAHIKANANPKSKCRRPYRWRRNAIRSSWMRKSKRNAQRMERNR